LLLLKSQKNGRIQLVSALKDVGEAELDYDRLHEVILNLCLNAIQAMPEGGCLEAGLTQDLDGKILIKIKDTGVGISSDQLPKIFDPFYTTKEKGAGLGLSVVYRTIKEHGGEIKVESRVGEGTTFTVILGRN
jgi:two-component system sensor histidine kinase HydH